MNLIKTTDIRKWYFLSSYLIFITGYFIIPNNKWHDTFFYFAILVPYLFTMNSKILKILKNSKIIQGIALLGLYLLLTPLWGEKGNLHEYARLIIKFIALMCFLCLTAELTLSEDRFVNLIFKALACVSIIGLILYIIIQNYSFSYPPARLSDIGDIYNPIFVGTAYGVLIIGIYYQLITQNELWTNLVYYLLMIVMFLAVILTQSRGPLLALLVSFIIGSIITRDIKMMAIIFIILLLSAILLLNKNIFVLGFLRNSNRYDLIVYSLRKISENPLLGHGIFFTEFKLQISKELSITKSHNLYLSTCLYGGLIGLILMLSFQARALWIGVKKFMSDKNPVYFVWLIYSSICIFTDHSYIIDRPYISYLFFWMAFGILSAYELSFNKKSLF